MEAENGDDTTHANDARGEVIFLPEDSPEAALAALLALVNDDA